MLTPASTTTPTVRQGQTTIRVDFIATGAGESPPFSLASDGREEDDSDDEPL